ncbi:MAG: ABC transporter ATP-binding protein [Chthoniobacterales bacterium]
MKTAPPTEIKKGQPLIEIHDLVQEIHGQKILCGLNLAILKGETLVFLGKSGGGKSVFLRHLIGLMHPVSGQILFEKKDITRLKEREMATLRKKISMVFQDGALFDSMDVFDNVAFPLRERGERNENVIKQRVEETLEMVNMNGHAHKMPVNLSGGMRKRVALARSVIFHPEVILYDEPTAGLDPIVSDSINNLIIRLQKQLHATSVVVTHDMVSAYHIGNRFALLNEGQLHFLGSKSELKHSTDPIVSNFIKGRSSESDL